MPSSKTLYRTFFTSMTVGFAAMISSPLIQQRNLEIVVEKPKEVSLEYAIQKSQKPQAPKGFLPFLLGAGLYVGSALLAAGYGKRYELE